MQVSLFERLYSVVEMLEQEKIEVNKPRFASAWLPCATPKRHLCAPTNNFQTTKTNIQNKGTKAELTHLFGSLASRSCSQS